MSQQIATGIVKSIGLRMLASCHLSKGDELSVLERKHVPDGWWLHVTVASSKNPTAVGKAGWVKQSTKDDGVLVDVNYESPLLQPKYPVEPWWLLAGIVTVIVVALLLFIR